MAKISTITLPDSSTYEIGTSTGIEFIYGTQTAKTGTWTGVTKDSELYDGKQIIYFLPFAGSGNATLNLTLAGGTATGAKNCYYNSTSRLTTHFGQYSQIHLVYHKALTIGTTSYEGWWHVADYDTTYTPASASPKMDGTAAVGTSVKYAREDHVHPTDTSRVPTSRKVNGHALSADVTITASDVSAIPTSQKGANSGVAELDANGKVPSSQLPSFVDDVLEYSAKSSFPATGETGKIYVDTATNLTYRWSGSAYVEISPSLALGETSSTAYRGDLGAAAYKHAVTNKGSAFTSGLYKITTNAEGHVTAATAVAKADITALGIPGSDTNTTYSAGTGLSLSSTTFNHSNSVTAGTAGTSSATSGSTLAVPYVTYDAQGHVTASGTHTHTVSGFLTSHQTIKQDGVTGATVNRYGACTTAAGTAAKAVSVTTGTFSLEAGARVSVKFNNANTANSPTLNVNSKGAKNIFHKGAQITSGANKALLAGICDFIYDGTQWHLVGNYIDTDNNTTYGLSISGHTVSIVAGGTTTSVTVPDNNTTYTANNENIGSASAGTAIPADDITAWSAGTMFSASASEGVVTFTAGTAPSLSYTAKSIPNISVTTKSVTTSITAS